MAEGSWYVLRVAVGSEHKVAERLRKWEGFSAFCPMVGEPVIRRGISREVVRPLWPSYCFASWVLGDESWHRVLGEDSEGRLIGIWGVIGGGRPTRVPAEVVNAWIARANTEGQIFDLAAKLEELRRGYAKGSDVRLYGGSWDGFTGTCQWVDDRGASVRVLMFGRETLVHIPHGGETKVIGITTAAEKRTTSRRVRRKIEKAVRQALGFSVAAEAS